MRVDVERIVYTYNLTKRQWTILMELDYLDVVQPALKKVGAIVIEYDGHWGRCMYVTTREPKNCQRIKEAILSLLGRKV